MKICLNFCYYCNAQVFIKFSLVSSVTDLFLYDFFLLSFLKIEMKISGFFFQIFKKNFVKFFFNILFVKKIYFEMFFGNEFFSKKFFVGTLFRKFSFHETRFWNFLILNNFFSKEIIFQNFNLFRLISVIFG